MATVTWRQRYKRLQVLLNSSKDVPKHPKNGDVDITTPSQEGDENSEVGRLLFSNKDLVCIGNIASGIDVVRCHLDGKLYARKTISKRSALRDQYHCFPKNERAILQRAYETKTPWAPQLVCSYQTPESLHIIMQYAHGGTLSDLLKFSSMIGAEGRISEQDARWWIPQGISAIHWCHTQQFAHRDIKPHNFVITSTNHLLLIDFGSSAPLLPTRPDGVQCVPKSLCLTPVGTVDYISPDILEMAEAAAFAAGLGGPVMLDEAEEGYGRETDWWSFGVMIYEMVYGVEPFFAESVKDTYEKIRSYETTLQFDQSIPVSADLKDLIRRLLTDYRSRLGRHGIQEIEQHPIFSGVRWASLHDAPASDRLLIPHFDAFEQPPESSEPSNESSEIRLSFLASFQKSVALDQLPPSSSSQPVARASNPWGNFTWGPEIHAFDDVQSIHDLTQLPPSGTRRLVGHEACVADMASYLDDGTQAVDQRTTFFTPMRRPTDLRSLPSGTIKRPRLMSERKALKQMIECVGASAQKKIMESGKKPSVGRISLRMAGRNLADMSFASVDGPPSPTPRSRTATSLGMASGEPFSLAIQATVPEVIATSTDAEGTDTDFDRMEKRRKKLLSDIARTESKLETVRVQINNR